MLRWNSIISILILVVCATTSNACTGICYSDESVTLAACNLDWADPVARIWFIPGQNKKHGVVYFGTDGAPAYGMNEKGLFFQGLINSYVKASKSYDKPFYEGPLFHKIMQECASLDEVANMLSRYNLKELERAKLFFGDINGNSMIAEGDNIARKQGPYQICRALLTQSQPTKPKYQYRFYKNADAMLRNKKVSKDLLRQALKRICENGYNRTVCSSVFDLRNGSVSLYYYQDFDNAYTFNIAEELDKGRRTVEILDLFPNNKRANEYRHSLSQKIEAWKATRQVVDVDTSVYSDYAGKYRTDIEGVPRIISITTEQEKIYYSTSEFGKGELSPTSAKTFFMVSHDGIWDVEFTDSNVVTKSKNYSYVAKSLLPQPIKEDNRSLEDARSSANR